MLPEKEYLKNFIELQKYTVDATNKLIKWISPGQSEKEVADKYNSILLEMGFSEHWYPILVCANETTGMPMSRRIHLPSNEIYIKENGIVSIDCTPMKGTVWTNWSDTVVIGKNSFFENLINDTKDIVEKISINTKEKFKTIGELYNFSCNLVKNKKIEILDVNKDVGHSIFQVPKGQTVEETPMQDRLLINNQFAKQNLLGIISIEPQLGRVNPEDNKMYGAKIQKVLFF
ncbi:MAG: M24 family metallopeptidase [Candidatus Shapirobacteria bacterium]|nr:M24 family metallopeptidase [Candidatus Shapirobacteria bacterium]